MYRCPFCRATQTLAVPSLEYKLLKLLVGVSEPELRDALLDAARAVARSEAGSTAALQKATADAPQLRQRGPAHSGATAGRTTAAIADPPCLSSAGAAAHARLPR